MGRMSEQGVFGTRPIARIRLCLLCVPLVLSVLAMTLAAEASAALHNPIPANAEEEPTNEFTDAEGLFAYFTSDIKGGTICVVAGQATDPNAVSCEKPAWGTPNFELTIGTEFSVLEGPPLQPGEWRLLVEDSQGGQHALSEVFYVTPCPECSREIGQEAVEQFKNAAAGNAVGATTTCLGMTAKELAGEIIGAHQRVKHLTDHADKFEAKEATVSETLVSLGAGAFGFVFSLPDEHAAEEKAIEILHELTCGLTLMYADIVKDPSDPNFHTVAEPEFSTFPALETTSGEAALRAVDNLRAFGIATLVSYERYLGAQEAGEEGFVHTQATAVASLGRSFIDEAKSAADALRGFASELDGLPEYETPTLGAEGREHVAKAFERIDKEGFSAEELQELHEVGLTENEISELRTHFSLHMSAAPVETTLGQLLREEAKNLEEEIPRYDAFVREAAAVAGRTASESTAPEITKRPADLTVTAGEPASFEAQASGEPAPEVQWEVSTNGGLSYESVLGATSTALSIPSTTLFDSGNRYRAVFTNSAGSVTSDGALLTVTPSGNGEADLAVSVSDEPDPVVVGEPLRYVVHVANNGPEEAIGVSVTEALPTGATVDSVLRSQGSCAEAGERLECALGSIASGGTATIEITVKLHEVGTATDSASVSGFESDPEPANNVTSETTTVTPPPAGETDLAISKTAPERGVVGEGMTYSIQVSNNGPDTATGVTMTDPLPEGVGPGFIQTSQGTCSSIARSVTCDVGTLASGASALITISVGLERAGPIANTAIVSGSQEDTNPSNNAATAETVVAPEPKIEPLSPLFTDSGLIALSVDAIGTNDPAGAPLRVHKSSASATVRKAYLFTATIGSVPTRGDVTLDGSPVSWDTTRLVKSIIGVNAVADVTSLVKSKVDSAPAGDVSFTAAEPNNSSAVDGELLAVTLNDPTAKVPSSVTLLFGAQSPGGDTFHLGLAEPVDKSDPDFALNMGLGISFGYQPAGQYSTLEVGEHLLTSSAGGQDDCVQKYEPEPVFSGCVNGELITGGGIGDSTDDPPDPEATDVGCTNSAGEPAPRCDDELYDLVPFVENGATSVTVNTHNPSDDDNIFFAAFETRGNATVVGEGITLAPTTATNPVGTAHTLTATVQDNGGERLSGKSVHFDVLSGPDAGKEGDDVTNNEGEATFTYTSAAAGTDRIVASFVNAHGDTQLSNEAAKTWVVEETAKDTQLSTSLSGGGKSGTAITVPEGTAVSDTATLTGENAGLATGKLAYRVYSESSCTKEVASGGEVSLNGEAIPASEPQTLPPGTYFWQATYGGDVLNKPSISDCAETLTVEAPSPGADATIALSDAPDPVTVGDTLTYTLAVHNAGPATAQTVKVSDALPPTVTLLSADSSQGSCSDAATLSCDLGDLAAGADATVTIKVRPRQTGTLSNVASVSSNTADPDDANNSDVEETAVVSVPPPEPGSCLAYPNFSSSKGLNLMGSAEQLGDVLRLTQAGGDLQAQTWFASKVPVAGGFTTEFHFQITERGGIGDEDGPGADGITFAIQNSSATATTGAIGGALGYFGIPNSLAVEFDTYRNPYDLNGNHVGVDLGESSLEAVALTPLLQDGDVHTARILYRPNGTLVVYVDDLQTPALTVQVDLSTALALDSGKAFVGFTAATGEGVENHDVLDWSYCPGSPPAPTETATSLSGEGKTGPSLTVKEGAEVSDHATLSGGNAETATGTVTYRAYRDKECKEPVVSAGEVTVSGEAVPASEAKVLDPGTYYWQASYSGDEANNASVSVCGSEVLTVEEAPRATRLETSLSGAGQTGATIAVPEGTSVTDTATLSGENAALATGKVGYRIYQDQECKQLVVSAGEVTVSGGTVPASEPQTLAPGIYYWQASYGGDKANAESVSRCGSEVETVEVAPKDTGLSTSLAGGGQSGAVLTVAEGTAVSDSATLSGENAHGATGKLAYKVYKDKECKQLVAPAGEVTVGGETVPASEPETLPPGTYYWQAAYGGDKLNKPSTSDCASETETVEGRPTEEGPSVDGIASAQHQKSATASLSTGESGDLIVAFVAADGPYPNGAIQTSTVSGGGLRWTLKGRETKALGDSEIWVARATGTLTGAPITAQVNVGSPGSPGGHSYDETITVVAFKNAPGVGAVVTSSSRKGAPTASLHTTSPNAWVWAVGNDWLSSISRQVPGGQKLWHEVFDAVGDTYWVQSAEAITKDAGTAVRINDLAPVADPYNLVLIEIL